MSSMTLADRGVVGGVGRDDPVAVELRLGEDLRRCRSVSSTVIAVASSLPRFARIWRAEASSRLPSGVRVVDRDERQRRRRPSRGPRGSSGSPHAHLTAAMISGARMRPSLSVSRSARVLSSNSRPLVGQASATQSFWSSLSSAFRSSPVSRRTCRSRPRGRTATDAVSDCLSSPCSPPVALRKHSLARRPRVGNVSERTAGGRAAEGPPPADERHAATSSGARRASGASAGDPRTACWSERRPR